LAFIDCRRLWLWYFKNGRPVSILVCSSRKFVYKRFNTINISLIPRKYLFFINEFIRHVTFRGSIELTKNYLFLLQIKYIHIDQFSTSINDFPKFLYNRLNKHALNIQTILEGIHCSPSRNISMYNRINSKLLASRNYWLLLPVTDHDAANVHNLFTRQSSRLARHNRFRYNIASSVISCSYRCVGSTRPNCPIWQHQPGTRSG